MAILDAFPCTAGHALLLPKTAAVSIAELEELPVETLGHVSSTTIFYHGLHSESRCGVFF